MAGFKELVKKAQKGDQNAFAELYSAVYKELYYYALTNLNSPDDAADAVRPNTSRTAKTSAIYLRDSPEMKRKTPTGSARSRIPNQNTRASSFWIR